MPTIRKNSEHHKTQMQAAGKTMKRNEGNDNFLVSENDVTSSSYTTINSTKKNSDTDQKFFYFI